MEFMVLLLFSLVLTARAAAQPPAAVLDTDGDELQRGQLYHAVSTMRPGGGLTMATRDSSSCPANVAQAPFTNELGRPLTFSPEDPDDDTVREFHTLYVTFPAAAAAAAAAAADDRCAASSSGMWQLESSTGRVCTGGSASDAVGPHLSRFAIQKAEFLDAAYQIIVCPCSMGVNRPACLMGCWGSLGVGADRLLVLGADRPHSIRFMKARSKQPQPQPQPSMKIRSVAVRPRPAT